MVPYWLVRLNDLLAWLNPALGGVAAILALLVIAVAAERFPAQAARPQNKVVVGPLAECPHAVLPPEWQELRLYD